MKTRILHIVLSMETGGLENGIVNIINYSNNEKFEMDILCLRAGGELRIHLAMFFLMITIVTAYSTQLKRSIYIVSNMTMTLFIAMGIPPCLLHMLAAP